MTAHSEGGAAGGPIPAERVLVRVAAALGAAGPAAEGRELEAALDEAAREADPEEVEEVLLQSYLFLGYPAALNAFGLWRRISGRPAGSAAPDRPGGSGARGEAVCREVYGAQYEGLRLNVRALHPDMDRWMVAEGYGKVLGRPGLPLVTRELCIVALLAVVDAPAQLYSHLRGALNVGAPPEAVEASLEEAFRIADPRAVRRSRETWRRVRARRAGGPDVGGDGV